MGPQYGLGLLLCLAAVSAVYSESSRDRLFVKMTTFGKQLATDRTHFTEEEKTLILQIHNSYRSIIEPSATDMRELVWDDDLEEYAWNHTQACTGAHSAGTMVKKFNPNISATWQTWTAMGENLYYTIAPWFSIEEALWMFWTEGQYYDIANHKCVSGKECGHFRIMVLARSARVGCSFNVCNNFTVSKYPTPAVFLSCSYNGQFLIYYKPYTVGPRGSDCTYEKQSYDYQYYRNGLCITPKLCLYEGGFDGNTSVVGLPSPYLAAAAKAGRKSTKGSCKDGDPTTEPSNISSSGTTKVGDIFRPTAGLLLAVSLITIFYASNNLLIILSALFINNK